MCCWSIDIQFCHERKCNPKVELTNTFHRAVGLWFLVCKLIARKSYDDKIIMRVGIPELLESLKLWCESALGCSVDDEDDFSFIWNERGFFAIGFLERDIVERLHKKYV